MKAKTIGSGWHFQPLRHSNARRYGHAGGVYKIVWDKHRTPKAQDFTIYKNRIYNVFEKDGLEYVKIGKNYVQINRRKFGKTYDFKTFHLPNGDTITAYTEKTRNGFRHMVVLTDKNGNEVTQAKATYLNRTWESFEYETAINNLLTKAGYKDEDKKKTLELLSGRSRKEVDEMFKTTAMVAQMGEVLAGNSKKEKNEWKKRMLKAGLPQLDIPEDWDTLSEDEKEKRLNNVIAEMKRKHGQAVVVYAEKGDEFQTYSKKLKNGKYRDVKVGERVGVEKDGELKLDKDIYFD